MTEREWQLQCYGRLESDIDKDIERWKEIYTPDFLAFSILSDVQELIERDRKEEARQRINVVKYITNKHWRKLEK